MRLSKLVRQVMKGICVKFCTIMTLVYCLISKNIIPKTFFDLAQGISKRTSRFPHPLVEPLLGSPARVMKLASSRKRWAQVLCTKAVRGATARETASSAS